jgi:crotonobetainyl-CoA:carnitine CoA-transferase CaiB-like acyl-CoA transferase
MSHNPPLSGIRVLDLSRFIAGPFAAMQLGDMGADVVKVEKKGSGDDTRLNHPKLKGESTYFLSFNRNKRSMELDFRDPADQETLRQLAATADILIENFRPGTLEKMGCGWDVLSALNPRLILVRISGFGQDGPYASRACFDVIAQAMGGIMNLTGQPDGPPTMAGTFMIDYSTALYATVGTLCALEARRQTGRGQLVEASLLETSASLLMSAIPDSRQLGQSMSRMGSRDRYTAPVNSFRCSDDAWVYLSAGTDSLFRRFVATADLLHLLDDPRFSSADARLANQEAIEAIVQQWVGLHPSGDVVDAMEQAGVPCAKVATIEEVIENPQLRHRRQIVDLEHPEIGTYTTHGVTVTLHDTPGHIARPAPTLGQHTDEVLAEWLGEGKTQRQAG